MQRPSATGSGRIRCCCSPPRHAGTESPLLARSSNGSPTSPMRPARSVCSTATTRSWSCRSSPTCRCGSPGRSAHASRGTCRRWARPSSRSPDTTLRASSKRTASCIDSPTTRSSTALSSSTNSNRSANGAGRSTTTSATTAYGLSQCRFCTPTSRPGQRSDCRGRRSDSPTHVSTNWSLRSGTSADRLSLHLQITTF